MPPLFPLIASLRAGGIALGFLLLTLACMPWQMLLLKVAPHAAVTFPMRYHRMVARLFGIHIRVVGTPVRGEGVLLLANHTSWLDIVLFSAVTPLSFVAKAEIARWPF
ncbi:MAG TPA: 1-acyl-sn-glycerol-3-phosphate acyltransferase, partial [Rhizomicrobium sp.]|nr:1-acyl-sn-glycerol-3-phosphate acyltransferase [Rhizomicrobium sp.]